MKNKLIILVFFVIFSIYYSKITLAQNTDFVSQIEISPLNPTTADSIIIDIHGAFPASNYFIYDSTITISDTMIQNIIYCCKSINIGVPWIKPFIRSFSIGTLPAGDYLIQSHAVNTVYCESPTQTMNLDTIYYSFSVTEYTSVKKNVKNHIRKEFTLFQNYPNPFNTVTIIKYTLPIKEKVKIEIFNTLGQNIKTILNKTMPKGMHKIKFDAQDLTGGIYLYKIHAGKFKEMKKMILLR